MKMNPWLPPGGLLLFHQRDYLTNGLSANNPNLIKINFPLACKIMIQSSHNFAHVLTTELSGHVQKCSLIWLSVLKLKQNSYFCHKQFVRGPKRQEPIICGIEIYGHKGSMSIMVMYAGIRTQGNTHGLFGYDKSTLTSKYIGLHQASGQVSWRITLWKDDCYWSHWQAHITNMDIYNIVWFDHQN